MTMETRAEPMIGRNTLVTASTGTLLNNAGHRLAGGHPPHESSNLRNRQHTRCGTHSLRVSWQNAALTVMRLR